MPEAVTRVSMSASGRAKRGAGQALSQGGPPHVACRRVKAETAEFERCVVQLQAQRAVHIRLFERALDSLAGGGLRAELALLQPETPGALPDLSARTAFAQMCAGLRGRLAAAQAQVDEIRAMLAASYARLNAEFAFGLSLDPPPALQRFVEQLDQIESGYAGYLGPSHALRRLQPRYMEQLRRMLLYKLRAVFESACGDVERWNKAASEQVDALLAERRCALGRRSEAVERMQRAIGGLEQRIDELAAQDARLRQLLQGVDKRARELRKHALPDPEAQDALAEG